MTCLLLLSFLAVGTPALDAGTPSEFEAHAADRALPSIPELGSTPVQVGRYLAELTTSKSGQEQVVVRDGVRVVSRWPKLEADERGWTKFGLLPLLGPDHRTLAMEHYSGGVHCCFYLRVYDAKNGLRLIFDSDSYVDADGNGALSVSDIDGDGVQEIVLNCTTFAYWGGLPYVLSPLFPVVFRYDDRRGAYRPDNRLLKQLTMNDEPRLIAEIQNVDGRRYPDALLAAVLRVVLVRVYSGQGEAAWSLFNRYYTLGDKDSVRYNIVNTLKGDRLYRAIRPE